MSQLFSKQKGSENIRLCQAHPSHAGSLSTGSVQPIETWTSLIINNKKKTFKVLI